MWPFKKKATAEPEPTHKHHLHFETVKLPIPECAMGWTYEQMREFCCNCDYSIYKNPYSGGW